MTLGLAGLDVIFLAVFWRIVLRWLARRGPALAAAVAALATLRVALAAAGWMPPDFDGSATAIDGAMALSIAGHLLLGFGLCCVVYATGLGALLWIERGQLSLSDLLLRSFLPGTIVLAAAALLAVAAPGGAVLAGAVCFGAAAPLARYRPQPGEMRGTVAPMLISVPAVALYVIVLSFRFYGPSAVISGAPLGDETIYVGWAADLAQHVGPVPNLAVEGFTTPYGNLLPSLLAAPLLAARWFDPYLFLSASLPALSLLALALTVPLLTRGGASARGRRNGNVDLLAIAGLAAVAFRYPSLLVESPPFAFLLPLIVSTVDLAAPGRHDRARSWQALITATLGTAVSKVVAQPIPALLPAPDVAQQLLRRAGHRQVAVAAAFGVLIVAYVAVALRTNLPLFLQLGGLGPRSWETIVCFHVVDPLSVACVVSRDLGAVVLAAAWAGSRATGLKLGVWAGIGLGFLMPFLFHTSLTTAVLVTALAVAGGFGPGERVRPWLLVAASLMLPQSVVAEYGGPVVALAWFAVAAFLTVALATRPQASDMRPGRTRYRAATAAALFSVVLLWGAGAGIWVGPESLPFTPDMRDIWRAVHRDTPPGARVFTDQTGDTASRLGGWNDALAA